MGKTCNSILEYDELRPSDMTGEQMSEYDMIVSLHDKYEYDLYNSARVSIQRVGYECLIHLSDVGGFGSMISEQSVDYAPVTHCHNQYDKISISVNEYDQQIGNFFLDGRLYSVGIGRGQTGITIDEESRIGMLKLVSVGSLTNVDINAQDFDGWVYPDGSSYNISDFKFGEKCREVFECSGSQFKVPHIKNILRIGYCEPEYERQGFMPLTPHSHDISFRVDISDVSATIQYEDATDKSTKGRDGQNVFKRRSADAENAAMQISISGYVVTNMLSVGNVDGDTSSSVFPETMETAGSDQSQPVMPSYKFTPVMVYIGDRS